MSGRRGRQGGVLAAILALGVLAAGGVPSTGLADVQVGIGVGYGYSSFGKHHHRYGYGHKRYRYGHHRGYRHGYFGHRTYFGGPRFYGRAPVYVPKNHRPNSTLFERRRQVAYQVGLEHGRLIRVGADDSAFKAEALTRLQGSGMALADIMSGGVYQFAYEAGYFRGKDGG